ncbi:hypothetical protein EDB85DRAFT_1895168 [Lactarius pseudohatsudake]|nr:hypothetical protein EDB85DRAFT_1895168 [Lactarius pseudohatsudake]
MIIASEMYQLANKTNVRVFSTLVWNWLIVHTTKGKDKGREPDQRIGEATQKDLMAPRRSRGKVPDNGVAPDGATFNGIAKTVLREQKKAAELGFMKMDIVNPPQGAHWGRFNDRKLNNEWVDELAIQFQSNLDNCTDESAIEVAVKIEWLKDVTKVHQTVDGKAIEDVSAIEFTDEGKTAIANNNLWALGGNHRREALILYVSAQREELEEKRKEFNRVEEESKKPTQARLGPAKGAAVERQDIEAYKKLLKALEDKIENAGYWVIKLYDRRSGSVQVDDVLAAKIEQNPLNISTAIFRFLSRNETKGSRKATEEELLLEIVDELRDAYDRDVEVQGERPQDLDMAKRYPRFMEAAKAKAEEYKDARGHRRLCSVPTFALGLVLASRIWQHYTHSPWFNIATLTKMLDDHGRFISEYLVESIETLERIANPAKPPLDVAELNDLGIQMVVSQEPGRWTKMEKRLSCMEKPFEGRGDASAWGKELLDKIDRCFIKNYKDNEKEKEKDSETLSDSLFFQDNKNINKFTLYCADVDRVLLENPKTTLPYAREYFAYAMMYRTHGHKFPMPLGTASVVQAVHKLATKYNKGLCEVISWLGTCVSWVPKLGAKIYIVHDKFDAALDTVSRDGLIRSNATGIRRNVFRIIFSHLTSTVVEMDTFLMKNNTNRMLVKDISSFKYLADDLAIVGKAASSGTSKKPNKSKLEPVKAVMKNKDTSSVVDFLSAVDWTAERFLTVETAVVESYRQDLLSHCPGANTLRNDLRDMLVKAVAPYSDEGSDGEGSPMVCKWEFPDNMEGGAGGAPKLKDLLEEWNSARAGFSKEKKDPIAVAIQSFEKNNFKYLACSGSAAEAQPGAIETLAHQLLSGLYEIMCKNKARIEHEGKDDNDDEDSDFDMDNTPIPVISRKPHVVSKEYKKELNYDKWAFTQSVQKNKRIAPLKSSLIPMSRQELHASPFTDRIMAGLEENNTQQVSESPMGMESQASELDPQQGSSSQAQPRSPVSFSSQHDRASTPPSREPSKHPAPSSPEDARPIKRQNRPKSSTPPLPKNVGSSSRRQASSGGKTSVTNTRSKDSSQSLAAHDSDVPDDDLM